MHYGINGGIMDGVIGNAAGTLDSAPAAVSWGR